MKKVLFTAIVVFFTTMVFAVEPPEWVDPNDYNGYLLIHAQELCQRKTYHAQWDIKDSNMGRISFGFVSLPAGMAADVNTGAITYTPPFEGVFFIKAILTCEPNNPAACIFPDSRQEAVAIRVLKSEEWGSDFTPFVE